MPEYGLTSMGPNVKRLDVIEDQIHTELSEKWGVNTRQNPESFLCHLIRNIADQIADLWAYGSDVYYSQFPNSAEGKNLDTAVQYGGIIRERAQKSYYRILCTGIDGTTIPSGTIIASDTNPPVNLVIDENYQISRSNCSYAEIVIASVAPTMISIGINGNYHAVFRSTGDAWSDAKKNDDMLSRMATGINTWHNRNPNAVPFTAETVGELPATLVLTADDPTTSNSVVLNENLTTTVIKSPVLFRTEEDGNIYLPKGIINKIVRAVIGLQSVENVGEYIAGQLEETDTELRQSYVDKIFKRSSSMVESIRSNILDQVQGVESCVVYENDTNETDEYGRWPHSVEVVADGTFDSTALAQVILDTKAGGISTYCDVQHGGVEVTLPGDYGENITIRYQTPEKVYVWYTVNVKFNDGMSVPLNYIDLVQDTMLECMSKLSAGDDVTPQRFYQKLYDAVPGVDYFDIGMYSTTNAATTPSSGQYTEKMVSITPRQKAVTDADRIEVGLVDD